MSFTAGEESFFFLGVGRLAVSSEGVPIEYVNNSTHCCSTARLTQLLQLLQIKCRYIILIHNIPRMPVVSLTAGDESFSFLGVG